MQTKSVGFIAIMVASVILGGAGMYFWHKANRGGVQAATPTQTAAPTVVSKGGGTPVPIVDRGDLDALRKLEEDIRLAQRDKVVAEAQIDPKIKEQIKSANKRIEDSAQALRKVIDGVQEKYKCKGCPVHESLTYLVRP